MSDEKVTNFDIRSLNKAVNLFHQEQHLGVLDAKFLLECVSILDPQHPKCVSPDTNLSEVVEILKQNRIGCVLITGSDDKLEGIFSERDCIRKVFNADIDLKVAKISEFMTKAPVCELPTISIGYALNLMSIGGFRHIPLVDEDKVPMGIISVKDIVDYIVSSFFNDIMTVFDDTLADSST